ncbi:MAG TPA: hypothetical protein VFA89_06895, partial [Terriglobales bacterium]|nr:hypothetical protein [Terriglobales bacterium]
AARWAEISRTRIADKIFEQAIKKERAMNFLSKLLQGISFVPAVVHGIEGLFGSRSGNDKKQAAMSFISSALSLADAVSNKEIVDQGKFTEGIGKVIDGTVECLNASLWAKAK